MIALPASVPWLCRLLIEEIRDWIAAGICSV